MTPPSLTCWFSHDASPWSLLARLESAYLLTLCPKRHHLMNICSLHVCFLVFFPFVVTVQNNTDARIRPLSFPLQGFMRLIPSIVKIGPPKFRGFLTEIAPHPNIRKLREIAYFLYNTNKSIYQ